MATSDNTPDPPFEVQIASTGEVIEIPAGVSIVDALAAHDIEVPTSCGHGLCGTCLTRVISGVPDHRDHHLSSAERASNQLITPCCSRSRSPRLVLDL